MLCLPGFGTHANTQNLPHFRAFPASNEGALSPEMPIFMAKAKLPNRPGFASYRVEVDEELDMSWPTFDAKMSVLKLQGSCLQRSSGNTQWGKGFSAHFGAVPCPFFWGEGGISVK